MPAALLFFFWWWLKQCFTVSEILYIKFSVHKGLISGDILNYSVKRLFAITVDPDIFTRT